MSGNESLGDYLKYAAECGVLEMVEGSMALSQELRGWTGIEAGKEMQELGGQKEEVLSLLGRSRTPPTVRQVNNELWEGREEESEISGGTKEGRLSPQKSRNVHTSFSRTDQQATYRNRYLNWRSAPFVVVVVVVARAPVAPRAFRLVSNFLLRLLFSHFLLLLFSLLLLPTLPRATKT